MRGQGRLYRRKGTANWWLDYSVRGVRHLESSGTAKHKEAADLLRARIGQRTDGKLIANPEKVTLADLRQGLERHYAREGNRSVERALQALAHVVAYFGEGAKALTLTRQAVGAYVEQRLAGAAAQKVAPASRDTVRYEVGVLNTCFSVAVEEGLLAVRPMFKRPPPGAARQGFFEPGSFAALLLELKDPTVRALVRFLHMTGWRSGEATGLTWGAVEWDDQAPEGATIPVPGPRACIRLYADQTKGGDARAFPFAGATELRELLLAQWKVRHGVCVFQRHGKPIKDFRAAWEAACTRSGLEGMLVHDLRRTAAREYRRLGVSEGEIMKLCGWKTRSMFDRYNIIDAADLSAAAAKRLGANETVAVQSGGPTASPVQLSSSAV